MKITVSKDGFKSKKLLHNTGRAAWIAGTIFLILVVPLIIEMDCEQQDTDLEMQQASILGSPSKDKPPRDGASPPPTIGPVYSNLTTSLSTPSARLSKHHISLDRLDDHGTQAGANQIALRPFLLPRANQKPPIHEAVSAILFILVVSLNLVWRRY